LPVGDAVRTLTGPRQADSGWRSPPSRRGWGHTEQVDLDASHDFASPTATWKHWPASCCRRRP